MDETAIREKFEQITRKELEVDKTRGSDRLMEDLGADELDVVELSMAVEEEFGIDIPDEDLYTNGLNNFVSGGARDPNLDKGTKWRTAPIQGPLKLRTIDDWVRYLVRHVPYVGDPPKRTP